MSMNRIQFQHGLSLPRFLADYGTEVQCAQALERTRWPEGFRCPRCQASRCSRVQVRGHTLFQCCACSQLLWQNEGQQNQQCRERPWPN